MGHRLWPAIQTGHYLGLNLFEAIQTSQHTAPWPFVAQSRAQHRGSAAVLASQPPNFIPSYLLAAPAARYMEPWPNQQYPIPRSDGATGVCITTYSVDSQRSPVGKVPETEWWNVSRTPFFQAMLYALGVLPRRSCFVARPAMPRFCMRCH